MPITAESSLTESTKLTCLEEGRSSALKTRTRLEGRWLHVVSHLDPRYGGLSAAVPELGSAIRQTGVFSVSLAAFCALGESHTLQDHPMLEMSYWPTSRVEWTRDRTLRARFRREIESADGLHIHGLWEQSTAIAARVAREMRKPYVLSAHGMLEPWALANRRWKKRIYAAFVERANIESAGCLHALTNAEAQDYRRFGYRGPIAVIPNGVHVPQSLSPELFFEHFPALRQKRLFLFLGRLHSKKGLDILIESWHAVSAQWPDAHLVLAGPDFEGTRAGLERRIQELGLTTGTTFTGMLAGQLKWSAFSAAECFLLPSYSEGLSVSVLEAMGAGVPVIVSEQCNLPEVRGVACGWVIQTNSTSLTSALQEALSNSCAANRQIGAKGCALVKERYTWSSVAAQMKDLYRWLQDDTVPQNLNLLVD